MNNIILGVIFFTTSLIVYILSPGSPKTLGYKSPQSMRNKNVWKWSNRFFGRLYFIGSTIYLLLAVILKGLKVNNNNLYKWINAIFLIYIFLCFVVTETYIYIKIRKVNSNGVRESK